MQPQLVLHRPMLHPGIARRAIEVERLGRRLGHGLLAIDMLAGVDRPSQQGRPKLRARRVEEDRRRIGQRGVEVRGPSGDAMGFGKGPDLVGVTPDQDRLGHQPVAIGQFDAALLADRQDRPDQVLVHPHPAGHAMHDHADAAIRHRGCSPLVNC